MGNNVPNLAPLFQCKTGVTLLGGGALDVETVQLALRFAPAIVAADGGARGALDTGHMPDAVYGDLDSLDPATRARIPAERVHGIAEQDSTDFDKALRHILAPFILAVGFTGARIDHELAAYHVLVKRPQRRCVILGTHDFVFHASGPLRLGLPIGTRLSLFPMGPVTGQSTGLKWPIDGITFGPNTKIGTSNETIAPSVELAFDGKGMLVILPREHLGAVLAAWAETAD